MIVRFVDRQGRPIVNATVCVVVSPEPYPDLAMLTDGNGEIDLDLTVQGTYGFSIFRNGQTQQVMTSVGRANELVSIRID